MKLPIPIALAKERHALARMFIDLSLAFRDTIPDALGHEPDTARTLIVVAVMLGHAAGQAMTSARIAATVQMPRQSVHRRLQWLVRSGLIVNLKGRYYIEPQRAARIPRRAEFERILADGFAVIGPYLSQIERPSSSD